MTVGSVVSTSVIRQYSDGEPKLESLFGEKGLIDNPKPPALVEKLVRQTTDKQSLVMDFFAGSGTTATAVLDANRADDGRRRYVLLEVGSYFDTVLKPRILKSVYSSAWSEGKPLSHDGIPHILKYHRLESYEDALNNLSLAPAAKLTSTSSAFARDYMLLYWLDFETKGSPSLLNIEWFADPCAYKLKVKKPRSDEYVERAVDLVETFNWLIGLHVEHMDRWRGYDAKFKREIDPELPEDTNTRLKLDGPLKETEVGAWRFRKIEGYTLRTPGDQNDRERALVIWRKLTDDLERDNLMLDEWFKKYRLSSQDTEFDVIYVNGSNNLPNLRRDEEIWKVRLIEESFHQAMWDVEG
jgi:adenine-specific DNA-methyltransferase